MLPRNGHWRQRCRKVRRRATLIASAFPRRGEIWTANLGNPPVRHWVLVVSLDGRNLSDRTDTVLIVPLGSSGSEGASVVLLPPGETGLPGPSFVKGHFIQSFPKRGLLDPERPLLSTPPMLTSVMSIRPLSAPTPP